MTIDLDALEAVAQAATPGPWEDDMLYNVRESNDSKCVVVVTKTCTERFPTPNDAAYIAAANPQTVLELVTELRRQRTTIHRLAKALRIQNRGRVVSHRECKHAQDRAARAVQELEEWKERNTLRWTSEPPTVPGWYWWKYQGEIELVSVVCHGNKCMMQPRTGGRLNVTNRSLAGSQWAGPIPEPEEPQ